MQAETQGKYPPADRNIKVLFGGHNIIAKALTVALIPQSMARHSAFAGRL